MSDISKISLNGAEYNIKDSYIRGVVNNMLSGTRGKIVIIGDSYGVDGSAGGKSWASYVEDIYTDCYRSTIGGTGFASDTYISQNWQSMLADLNISNKNEIEQIVCIGGANDANLINDGKITTEVLKHKINLFCTYVASEFPNAKIKIAFVGWYKNANRFNSYNLARSTYSDTANNNKNASYFSNGEPIMHNTAFINSDDFIHPTATASVILGEFALSMIADGTFNFNYLNDVSITPASNLTVKNNIFKCAYSGRTAFMSFIGKYDSNTYFTVTLNSAMSITETTLFEIGDLNGTPMISTTPAIIPCSVLVGEPDGSVLFVPAHLYVQKGKLYVRLFTTSELNVRVMQIPLSVISIPIDNN